MNKILFFEIILMTTFSSVVTLGAIHPRTLLKYESFKSIAFSNKEKMQDRWSAMMSMTQFKGEKSISDLKKLAQQKEWFLKNAALLALKKVKPTEAVALAKKLLNDKALVVRSMAVEVLKDNLTEDSRKLLWSEIDKPYNFRGHQSLWIRKQMISALAEKPYLTEKLSFGKYLRDSDLEVTQVASKAYNEAFQ